MVDVQNDDFSKDDLLEELVGDVREDDAALPTTEDVKDLKDQIDDLSKEKHGLLKEVQGERKKRQEMSGKLTQLTDTVNSVIAARENPVAKAIENPQRGNLPVTFTDDGEAYVDRTVIDQVVSPYEQKIAQLEQTLQNTTASQAATNDAEKIKLSIVGEDERFALANNKYQAARKWVNDRATDFTTTNNVGRALTSGEAMDYVFDSTATEEFKTRFPELNIVDIVTAEDSQHHYRSMLNGVAEALNPSKTDAPMPGKEVDSRFKKVLSKPSGLSSATNAKGAELSITEKVGSLSATDFVDLTDAQVDSLMKAMESEQ